MRASRSNRFSELKKKVLDSDGSVETLERPVSSPTRRSSLLEKRQATVAAAAAGKVKTIKLLQHDPARIRPWANHNRLYAALSTERCSDLIDGFRRAGQQFPAIVRVVNDSDDYDYEFICGARRHWTATYLERDLLIEVRDLDDRAAFLLQDIENRDREDVSDYERACDYLQALPVYFEGKMTHMADQLQIDKGNFSRFLALAKIPSTIVKAYADIRELVVRHGTTYQALCKNPEAKERILATAEKLAAQGGVPGKTVLAELKKAAKPAGEGGASHEPEYGVVNIKHRSGRQVNLSFIMPPANNTKAMDSLQKQFESLLDELREHKSYKE